MQTRPRALYAPLSLSLAGRARLIESGAIGGWRAPVQQVAADSTARKLPFRLATDPRRKRRPGASCCARSPRLHTSMIDHVATESRMIDRRSAQSRASFVKSVTNGKIPAAMFYLSCRALSRCQFISELAKTSPILESGRSLLPARPLFCHH